MSPKDLHFTINRHLSWLDQQTQIGHRLAAQAIRQILEESMRNFSDEELQQELDRRAKAKEIEEKARKVKVLCPICNGSGQEHYSSIQVVTGKESGIMNSFLTLTPCTMCEGKKTIIAVRV